MARKKEYPGSFRLTLATARRLAVQEFGTAKGLEPDRGTCLEGFFTMQMGNMGVILLGVLIAVLGTVFIDRIVWGLGASSILFPYCKEYLFILLLFTPASILQVLFQNLIVTAGRPGMGMVLGVSAGIVNILLDYIFMVPFHMGIKGAAFGTGIGYMIPAVIGLWFFSAKRGSLHFRKPVIDFSVLAESCTNGFSEMVSQAATAVTTFLFNCIMMKLLGENGVAVITIIIYRQIFDVCGVISQYCVYRFRHSPATAFSITSKGINFLFLMFQSLPFFP